jgi:hypothetical protein
MSEACATCRFWAIGASPEGECRRHAPKPWLEYAPDNDRAAWWPLVHDVQWCGEHQPREAEPEKPKSREPGWYWVRRRYCAWQPARADGRGGWNVGSALYFDDSWEEIGPRLDPPA